MTDMTRLNNQRNPVRSSQVRDPLVPDEIHLSIKGNKPICALITAPGQAGIAVIRVSGESSENCIRPLCTFLPVHLESHRVYYGYLRDPLSGDGIDEVLVTYFTSGRSFTGEHTFEISCHGSQVIASEILSHLCENGARMASRGEFTFRAFMNGRIDLVQAESILEVIQSRSKRAAQLALKQLQGGFSKHIRELLQDLTWVLANLEANIDFAAEDIEIASSELLSNRVEVLIGKTQTLIDQQKKGRILKSGFEVVLAGRPNAGKSSLLNEFLNEERAIVTEVPGTTRDLIDGEIVIDGFRVTITDTAGLRETLDIVEKVGVERTRTKVLEVDRVFYLVDGEVGWQEEDSEILRILPEGKVTIVWNKCDLSTALGGPKGFPFFQISARTGQGLDELKSHLANLLTEEFLENAPSLSNARHFECLRDLKESLVTARDLLDQSDSPDLIALELQSGMQALHELLGLVFDDSVMDRVFQEFCIGK
jgi:tRNA modification GTPase